MQKQIEYDHFESADAVGGNWRHGVYPAAHIISSKKTTEFPDFPMPEHYPDFPGATQMLDYLCNYAQHFGLTEKITFNTTVESIRSVPNDTGWDITLNTGQTHRYEGVIICNGHHWDRRWPEYPGEFTGELIHSKDYKEPSQLAGKRVLVIGGGNSSCDIVSEAARVSASAHLSIRRGYWFLPKTFYGIPTADMLNTPMPVWMQRIYLGILIKIVVGDYAKYGLPKPDHRIFDHHPTINSELLHYLKHGRIQPHPDIKRFDGKKVEFADGKAEEIDMIVCGTGYKVSIPFLENGIIDIEGSVVKVRWGMVAPHHKQLYPYGWAQARYGFGPLLTPASDLLADLILLQRKLKHPLGELLERLGQPFPHTHLVDPMEVLRKVRLAKSMSWILPIVDKYLMPEKDLISKTIRNATPLQGPRKHEAKVPAEID